MHSILRVGSGYIAKMSSYIYNLYKQGVAVYTGSCTYSSKIITSTRAFATGCCHVVLFCIARVAYPNVQCVQGHDGVRTAVHEYAIYTGTDL